ncbi:MAG: uroporphyrinogen decarboxylase [Candidatus Binatia bacterium]|nr:uroporphyrinogen decarboxylase [Candidatus Binatia bacterium]MDG1958388.1 uroporphyrinogen decarboxylase [Candidatus Binatia bacterium]MDG2009315.1 uroporphyrinogen decarboxylase [Candidatus Binatia bacterium]HAC79671.1 uroporphyrinogen decarboxylase [Deltaproteobacteria bacterium]
MSHVELPFIAACRREAVPHTPVWLMRQAGRYLPEYRAIREKMGFLDLCKTPEIATEVTVQPIERFGMDAAILFADILLPLEPLGLGLSFEKGDGPALARPIRDVAHVHQLPEVDVEDSLSFVFDTVRGVRERLGGKTALIGFAGAPFTLASYAIEGGGSRNYLETKRFMYSEPEAWEELMRKLVKVTVDYLNGQVAAGAQAIQVFDSWVGHLAPEDYEKAILPHMRDLFSRLDRSVPTIYFGTGTPGILELIASAGSDVVGVDWRIRMDEAWRRIGHDRAVQGNLDPLLLFAPLDTLRARVKQILDETEGRPGHIMNLGHGILPQTPIDAVRCFVDTVHELSAR